MFESLFCFTRKSEKLLKTVLFIAHLQAAFRMIYELIVSPSCAMWYPHVLIIINLQQQISKYKRSYVVAV